MSKEEVLSITRQCELSGLARSTYSCMPEPFCDEVLELMKLIDQCYLELPFYGTRHTAHGASGIGCGTIMGLLSIANEYSVSGAF